MKTYRRKRKTEKMVMTPQERADKKAMLYKKRLRAKKRRRNFVLFLLLAVIVLSIALFTPIFSINKIEVKGNSTLVAEEIIQTGRIFTGDNLWLMRKGRAEELIMEIPYVDSVKISRVLPGTVIITVKEATPYAYIETESKTYLVINRDGKILEQVKKAPAKLKQVIVSKLSSDKPGDKFAGSGTLTGKSYRMLLEQLKKEGYEDRVSVIEINGDDITFKYNNLTVKLGDTQLLEYKFAFLKTFIDERGTDVEGSFDISAPNVGGYYKETYGKEPEKTEEETKSDEEIGDNEQSADGSDDDKTNDDKTDEESTEQEDSGAQSTQSDSQE